MCDGLSSLSVYNYEILFKVVPSPLLIPREAVFVFFVPCLYRLYLFSARGVVRLEVVCREAFRHALKNTGKDMLVINVGRTEIRQQLFNCHRVSPAAARTAKEHLEVTPVQAACCNIFREFKAFAAAPPGEADCGGLIFFADRFKRFINTF